MGQEFKAVLPPLLTVLLLLLLLDALEAQTCIKNAVPADVALVIDGSATMDTGDFDNLINILQLFVEMLALDEEFGNKVGIYTATDTGGMNAIPLNSNSEAVLSALTNQPYPSSAPVNWTHSVSNLEDFLRLSPEARPSAAKVGIVISHSEPLGTNGDTTTSLRDVTVHLAGLGIDVFPILLMQGVIPAFTGGQFSGVAAFTNITDMAPDLVNLMSTVEELGEGTLCTDPMFDYHPHFTDCTQFIKCTDDGQELLSNGMRYLLMSCPEGLFFNPSSTVCDFPSNSRCPTDPCSCAVRGKAVMLVSCSSYWVCDNSRTVASECCASGERFQAVTGLCVPDGSCTDTCVSIVDQPGDSAACMKTRDPSNNKAYMEAGVSKTCTARGRFFSPQTCDCVLPIINNPDRSPSCASEVGMVVNQTMEDMVGGYYIDGHNVQMISSGGISQDEAFMFDGISSYIDIPLYTNTEFGGAAEFLIIFKQMSQTSANSDEVLFSNGGCSGDAGSIAVILDNVANEVVVSLDLGETSVRRVMGTYQPGSWTVLTLCYDGLMEEITLQVNGAKYVTSASGNIQRVNCPLSLGRRWDRSHNFYTGIIDTFTSQRCVMDPV